MWFYCVRCGVGYSGMFVLYNWIDLSNFLLGMIAFLLLVFLTLGSSFSLFVEGDGIVGLYG